MVKLREYASKLDKNVGVHVKAESSQLTNMQCSTYLVTLCIHPTQQPTFCLYLLLKELRHGPRILKILANFSSLSFVIHLNLFKSWTSLSILFFCITLLVLSYLKEIIILIFLSVKK